MFLYVHSPYATTYFVIYNMQKSSQGSKGERKTAAGDDGCHSCGDYGERNHPPSALLVYSAVFHFAVSCKLLSHLWLFRIVL